MMYYTCKTGATFLLFSGFVTKHLIFGSYLKKLLFSDFTFAVQSANTKYIAEPFLA